MKKRNESPVRKRLEDTPGASTATGKEKPGSRGALQQWGGPFGRIHRGALNAELVETFKRYPWASHVALETASSGDTLAHLLIRWKRVSPSAIERWCEDNEFAHRALLALAE